MSVAVIDVGDAKMERRKVEGLIGAWVLPRGDWSGGVVD